MLIVVRYVKKTVLLLIVVSIMALFILLMLTLSPAAHPNSGHSRLLGGFNEAFDRNPVMEAEIRRIYCGGNSDDAEIREKNERAQKRLPNALIIGARKCGTGALRDMLHIHPDVQIVPWEVHFFDDKYSKGLEWYRQNMPLSYENQVTIEKSPRYFLHPDVPARIKAMDPNIKLLLIVRDPVVRFISDYTQQIATNYTNKTFNELALLPNGEVNEQSHAVQVSQYVIHLRRYLKFFDRDQIHVVDGDTLIFNPYGELKKVEKFLNLTARLQPSNFYFSEEKGFFCMIYEKQEKCMGDNKGRIHAHIEPGIIMKLRRFYKPYNEQFYDLVGHNFNWSTS